MTNPKLPKQTFCAHCKDPVSIVIPEDDAIYFCPDKECQMAFNQYWNRIKAEEEEAERIKKIEEQEEDDEWEDEY